jgi:hypothetical protein
MQRMCSATTEQDEGARGAPGRREASKERSVGDQGIIRSHNLCSSAAGQSARLWQGGNYPLGSPAASSDHTVPQ